MTTSVRPQPLLAVRDVRASARWYATLLGATRDSERWASDKPLWAHYLGAFTGQLGYEILFLPVGALFVLGAVLLLGYCVIFVGAAAVAARLRAGLAGRFRASLAPGEKYP